MATISQIRGWVFWKYRLAVRWIWYAFYSLIAQHLPVSYRYGVLGWVGKICRRAACQRIFKVCGARVNVEKGAYFETGWELEIGDDSSLGVRCSIPYNLKVGKDVMMAPEVVILGENHEYHRLDVPMRLQGSQKYPPVRIEDDVWIGTRAIILPGLTIERGSIIGAGSVVTKDVPPYAICAGNPARVIRYRDPSLAPD